MSDHDHAGATSPEAPVPQAVAPAAGRVPGPAPTHDVADGVDRQLDPRVVTTWRIGGSITASVFSGITLLATLITALSIPGGALFRFGVLPLAWAMLSAVMLTGALMWPGARYRHTFYRVFPAGMEIRRGVLWRSVIHLPKTRVQHTDVNQGPIERMFGLATLIVYTAGTEHASVALSGLPRETAFLIRDHLLPGLGDDAV